MAELKKVAPRLWLRLPTLKNSLPPRCDCTETDSGGLWRSRAWLDGGGAAAHGSDGGGPRRGMGRRPASGPCVAWDGVAVSIASMRGLEASWAGAGGGPRRRGQGGATSQAGPGGGARSGTSRGQEAISPGRSYGRREKEGNGEE
uniref:Uncharacterized protein n=1 Tax=Setaria viridis TaxID=4556 RepID=A0A4U6T475_SETVI|nr:hypothetical protein SEVIR_9G318700v2 [Setaria viridis]